MFFVNHRMKVYPPAWTIELQGFVVDVRSTPGEIQGIAFRKTLIPYMPADR